MKVDREGEYSGRQRQCVIGKRQSMVEMRKKFRK